MHYCHLLVLVRRFPSLYPSILHLPCFCNLTRFWKFKWFTLPTFLAVQIIIFSRLCVSFCGAIILHPAVIMMADLRAASWKDLSVLLYRDKLVCICSLLALCTCGSVCEWIWWLICSLSLLALLPLCTHCFQAGTHSDHPGPLLGHAEVSSGTKTQGQGCQSHPWDTVHACVDCCKAQSCFLIMNKSFVEVLWCLAFLTNASRG